ncbi:sterile alpha motif domain-containing protein [Senna tora]|uniref:Sterile alpha motif domain-containing protein n=1 Tax=Senna tora TaxID=362788 RepID=A0A834TD01_9FABA|nr:sterile alpha motif domain-containing protein [Senna tora]
MINGASAIVSVTFGMLCSSPQLMVKTKLRHSGRVPGWKSSTPSCLIDPTEDDHLNDDDDWVIVKKQRVTILIPAAPLSKSSITANHGPSHLHLMPPKIVNEQEKTVSLASPKEIQVPGKVPPMIETEIPRRVSILKAHGLLGVSKASKAIKQPRILLAPRRSSPNLGTTLNQGLRASNLERKLERAGGLSRWLTSLGLGQFVRIFQGRSLSKYQLVNLTMKKLKDMGANAVGPRRKLIHALDCVCQPYCFEAS